MELRDKLKEALPTLVDAQYRVRDEMEDLVYRLYHRSFKVYNAQATTLRTVMALRGVMPDRQLDPMFIDIIKRGTGKRFTMDVNSRWEEETLPIVEALFHAKHFIDLAVKYAQRDPEKRFTFGGKMISAMEPGYAALLELYGLR